MHEGPSVNDMPGGAKSNYDRIELTVGECGSTLLDMFLRSIDR